MSDEDALKKQIEAIAAAFEGEDPRRCYQAMGERLYFSPAMLDMLDSAMAGDSQALRIALRLIADLLPGPLKTFMLAGFPLEQRSPDLPGVDLLHAVLTEGATTPSKDGRRRMSRRLRRVAEKLDSFPALSRQVRCAGGRSAVISVGSTGGAPGLVVATCRNGDRYRLYGWDWSAGRAESVSKLFRFALPQEKRAKARKGAPGKDPAEDAAWDTAVRLQMDQQERRGEQRDEAAARRLVSKRYRGDDDSGLVKTIRRAQKNHARRRKVALDAEETWWKTMSRREATELPQDDGLEAIKLSKPWAEYHTGTLVHVDARRAQWLRENGYEAGLPSRQPRQKTSSNL